MPVSLGNFLDFSFCLCIWVFCLWVCFVNHMCAMPTEGRRGHLVDALDLEAKKLLVTMCVLGTNPSPTSKQHMILTVEHLSSTSLGFFCLFFSYSVSGLGLTWVHIGSKVREPEAQPRKAEE